MNIRSLLAAALIVPSLQASAQMAVLDVKNLAEATKQVRAWADQYRQMKAQIDAMNFQIQSMTGDRGMSRLLAPGVPALPSDWTQSMTNLSALARQIKQSQAVLTPDQATRLSPDLQRLLSQAQDISASNQAMAQTAFNDAAVRQRRLQILTGALATTTDPKAAYDLANRIAIEHAELVKDQNQLEAAGNGAAAQDRAQQLMINQMRASSFGTAVPKIDTSLP